MWTFSFTKLEAVPVPVLLLLRVPVFVYFLVLVSVYYIPARGSEYNYLNTFRYFLLNANV